MNGEEDGFVLLWIVVEIPREKEEEREEGGGLRVRKSRNACVGKGSQKST